MNKLLTEYNNGFPLLLDDLRFIDDIYRSGIESILKAFANNTDCIVFGCEKTYDGNTLSISAGAIWHDNELFAFAGGTQTNPSNDYYFKVIEVDESFRMFGDGTTSNPVHRLRYVTFNAGTLTESISIDIPMLKDLVKDYANQLGSWTTLLADSGNLLKYRKIMNNSHVQLIGNVRVPVNEHFGTLPAGYRPISEITSSIPTGDSALKVARVSIGTTGSVDSVDFTQDTYHFNIIFPIV